MNETQSSLWLGPTPQVVSLADIQPVPTCLVVEDDADARGAMVDLLTTLGVVAIAATSARRAVALCAEVVPDLALIDVGLPDLDGLALGRALRDVDAHRHVGLAAWTGFPDVADRARAAGFDLLLVKPVPVPILRTSFGALAALARRRRP